MTIPHIPNPKKKDFPLDKQIMKKKQISPAAIINAHSELVKFLTIDDISKFTELALMHNKPAALINDKNPPIIPPIINIIMSRAQIKMPKINPARKIKYF